MGPIWKDSKPVPLLISRDNFAIWEGGSTILIRIKRQMYKDVNDVYNLCRSEADALKQSGTREASPQRTRDFVYLSRVLKHALYCAYQEAKEADGPKDKVFNWPREEITMDLTLAIQNLRANRSFKIGALLTKEQCKTIDQPGRRGLC
ncbi:hypothetical protein FRB99_002292 [Tulasnella sp. 403]|nr:hypothetical protein FRB99_002292 [Tulasnella sp. 403]